MQITKGVELSRTIWSHVRCQRGIMCYRGAFKMTPFPSWFCHWSWYSSKIACVPWGLVSSGVSVTVCSHLWERVRVLSRASFVDCNNCFCCYAEQLVGQSYSCSSSSAEKCWSSIPWQVSFNVLRLLEINSLTLALIYITGK